MQPKFLAIAAIILSAPSQSALASILSSVNQIVVFGDSLSDNGNAAIVLGGTIPGNYAPNAFVDGSATNPPTTGPFGLWVDQFAALAGLPDPKPFLANPAANTNYAVASAQTGSSNPQDVNNQLAAFAGAHPFGAPSNSLYAIWAGSNDVYNGNSGAAAADSLFNDIRALATAGGKYFLWFNIPQLGNTPRGAGSPALNTQSTNFDNEWAVDIAQLRAFGIVVAGVDVNSEYNQILANPGGFGFGNVTSPAQGIPGNPNSYLFWDKEHPTTAANALVAQLAYNAVATPEPGSLSLLFGGLALIGLRVRGRRS